jgi:O-methyltransferase
VGVVRTLLQGIRGVSARVRDVLRPPGPEEQAYRALQKTVTPYTLIGPERMRNLHRLAKRAEDEGLPGDVVECGVCNGGSAAILAHLATRSPLGRTVWLFDSFEGMPPTTAEDLPSPYGRPATEHVGKEVGSLERVREVLQLVGADLERVRIVKGWFQDTFPTVTVPRIAILNIDSDWYQSVKLCLETFFDAVVPGGFVSLDDYGYWPGCKQAVDEFMRARGLSCPLVRVDFTARWFQKR